MQNSFTSGEVIRARVCKAPFIFHYGIIIHWDGIVYVLHNPFPIGPRIDTVDDFFATRSLEKNYGKLTGKTDQQLLSEFNAIKDKEYSLLMFNCEDFINKMIGYFKFQSGKIQLFSFIALALVGSYFFYKKLK